MRRRIGDAIPELFAQSDELNKKQEAAESLQTRLDQVDQLTGANLAAHALNQSRSDLEARKEIAGSHVVRRSRAAA